MTPRCRHEARLRHVALALGLDRSEPSKRGRRDDGLQRRIEVSSKENWGACGRHRIRAERKARGERLVKQAGLQGASRRRWKTGATRRDPRARPGPGPGEPELPPGQAGRTLGSRHHVRALGGRPAVPGGRAGRPEPPDRGVANGDSQHTSLAFGPGCREAGREASQGFGRRRVRQRDERELLHHPGVRVGRAGSSGTRTTPRGCSSSSKASTRRVEGARP